MPVLRNEGCTPPRAHSGLLRNKRNGTVPKAFLSLRQNNDYPSLSRILIMTTISYQDDPTAEEALVLFKKIEEKFPLTTLGSDKWYIVTVRCSFTFTLFHLIIAF
jgi:hypothetical protein